MDHLGHGLKMAVVVVTGASGYLGGEVLRALKALGVDAVGLARQPGTQIVNCDLLDNEGVKRILREIQPRCIIHCAWETPKSAEGYANTIRAGRGIRMIESLLAVPNVPIIYVSSMTVYGMDSRCAVRHESDAGMGGSAYGVSKFKGEQLLRDSGVKGFAARLPGLFGGQRKTGLVWGAIDALERNARPELPAQPLLWAGMDVRDAAHMLAKLSLVQPADFDAVNLGYSDVYSVSRLVDGLADIYGVSIPYDVAHPDFAFDLRRAEALELTIPIDLRKALLKLKKERI